MNIGIRAISYYLPEKRLSNEELSALYPTWTADKILKKTGISSRHIANQEECVSDMAERAARRLFSENSISPEEIDYVILVTETPDHQLPPTACLLQERLKIPSDAGALDINLGCSGYIYGLQVARSLVASQEASRVLLLTGEMYSKHIHKMDKSTRTIFGDGATASLITAGDSVSAIQGIVVGTNGKGYRHLIIPSGGGRLARSEATGQVFADEDGSIRSQDHLYMNGPEILLFTMKVVPKLVEQVLKKNKLTMGEIDWFVFHQANAFILQELRKKLKISEEKFIIDMEDVGNTVSSTIPLALKRQVDLGRFHRGEQILLAGFGVGLSWGGTVIKMGDCL